MIKQRGAKANGKQCVDKLSWL